MTQEMQKELDNLKHWMVNSWLSASCLGYAELAVGFQEYKRCKRIAEDEFIRWKRYEDLHKR